MLDKREEAEGDNQNQEKNVDGEQKNKLFLRHIYIGMIFRN